MLKPSGGVATVLGHKSMNMMKRAIALVVAGILACSCAAYAEDALKASNMEIIGHSDLKGAGTVDDPILSKDVTAQCSSFSRAALLYGGYFDPRFRGFGQEHVEHSRRLLRVGYGGTYEDIDGEVRPIYKLLKSNIQVLKTHSFFNMADSDRNWLLCRQLLFEEAYRAPWRDDTEMAQFRAEMTGALHGGG